MVVILTGPVHAGKTSLLRRLVTRFQEGGLSPSGYLTFSTWSGGMVRGYELADIREGGRVPFLKRRGLESWQRVGPYYLIPDGLRRAKRIIRRAEPSSILVVDEWGPLELQGGGVRSALDKSLSARPGPVLLVVRESILDEALKSLGVQPAGIIDVRDDRAEEELVGPFTAP